MNDKEEIKKEQKLDLIKEREMLYKNKKTSFILTKSIKLVTIFIKTIFSS